MKADELTWEKPGAGQWMWSGTHLPGAPTPLQQAFQFPTVAAGIGAMFERYGIPLKTMSFRLVNGRVYTRLLPLVSPEKDSKQPPAPVLWTLTRVLPVFRARNRNARRAIEQRIWRDELRLWQTEQRTHWLDANLALQDEPIADYDDDALADHLRRAFDHVFAGHRLHFELHGTDLAPIGDLLVHCESWGIERNEAMAALEGASPASAGAATALAHLGKLVADAPHAPASLDEVRAIGPAASDALDEYLREFGLRVVTSYDVDGLTLMELPSTVLASIRAAANARPDAEPDDKLVEQLRTRVPANEQATFDDLLEEARCVYGLRDDNGPLTVEWPVGLLRRAVLEVGGRLQARGALHDASDAVELDLDELTSLLCEQHGPSPDEVRARGARRKELAAVEPPIMLGDDEPAPPLSLMPEALARVAAIAICAAESLEAPPKREAMIGLGIGSETYTGRARVAHVAEDVLSTLEEGDVLVTTFTNPAYNTVLMIAGALVCEEGGPLSHAAVMARELGIPAVIGARRAMTEIADGDTVEVDPVAGRVRVASRSR